MLGHKAFPESMSDRNKGFSIRRHVIRFDFLLIIID